MMKTGIMTKRIVSFLIEKKEKEKIRKAVKEGYYLAISEFIRTAVRNLLATAVNEPTYLETVVNNEEGEINCDKREMVHICYRITPVDNMEILWLVKKETFKTQSILLRKAVRDEIDIYKRRREINNSRQIQAL